jgi:hypothetical protein
MNMKLFEPIMKASMADREALSKLKLTPNEQAKVRKLDEEVGKAIQKQFPNVSRGMSEVDQKKMVTAVLGQLKARKEKLKTVLGPARFAQYTKFYSAAIKDPKLGSSFSNPEMEKRMKEMEKRSEIYRRVDKEFAKKHLTESQIYEKALTKVGATPAQKSLVKKAQAEYIRRQSFVFTSSSSSGKKSSEQWRAEASKRRDSVTKIQSDYRAQMIRALGAEKYRIFQAEVDRINTIQGREKQARIESEEKKAGIKPFGGPQGGMGRPNGGGRPGGPRSGGPR